VAVDCDAGKLWIIDSAGSVIPSGDPATGTGGFTIPSTQDYRFFLYLDADPELEPLVTLKNTSSHGVPAGFTHHTAPATGGTETVHKVFRMGGAEHTFGTVAPSGANGKIGDIYTDTTGKNVYQKTAASTWTLRYSYT
jgi:hypothetical protein